MCANTKIQLESMSAIFPFLITTLQMLASHSTNMLQIKNLIRSLITTGLPQDTLQDRKGLGCLTPLNFLTVVSSCLGHVISTSRFLRHNHPEVLVKNAHS